MQATPKTNQAKRKRTPKNKQIQKNKQMEEQKQELALGKVDNIATGLVVEDTLKGMLLKTKNVNFKPWQNNFAPKYPHSCFGDFPKNYLPKRKPRYSQKNL